MTDELKSKNMAAYVMATLTRVMTKIAGQPIFGNIAFLGAEEIVDPEGTATLTFKASSSKDLQIIQMSFSIDGTPVDRMDPWQMDILVDAIEFTSELSDRDVNIVLDGQIPIGDLFGRDVKESVIDLIRQNEEFRITVASRDPFHSHRVNGSIRCAFYPPILSGLQKVGRRAQDVIRD